MNSFFSTFYMVIVGFNMEMVQNIAQITRLQEENDNMKCQLEAYKNEIELTKKEQDNSGENKVSIFVVFS